MNFKKRIKNLSFLSQGPWNPCVLKHLPELAFPRTHSGKHCLRVSIRKRERSPPSTDKTFPLVCSKYSKRKVTLVKSVGFSLLHGQSNNTFTLVLDSEDTHSRPFTREALATGLAECWLSTQALLGWGISEKTYLLP